MQTNPKNLNSDLREAFVYFFCTVDIGKCNSVSTAILQFCKCIIVLKNARLSVWTTPYSSTTFTTQNKLINQVHR